MAWWPDGDSWTVAAITNAELNVRTSRSSTTTSKKGEGRNRTVDTLIRKDGTRFDFKVRDDLKDGQVKQRLLLVFQDASQLMQMSMATFENETEAEAWFSSEIVYPIFNNKLDKAGAEEKKRERLRLTKKPAGQLKAKKTKAEPTENAEPTTTSTTAKEEPSIKAEPTQDQKPEVKVTRKREKRVNADAEGATSKSQETQKTERRGRPRNLGLQYLRVQAL